jgi:guanylate kinase
MIVLVGASASGKTELAKILYHTYGYKKCVTTTTRPERIGERDGIDYHFLTEDTFKSLMAKQAFYEVTEYSNRYYVIQKKDVIENGVVIVDPNGANALVDQADDVYVVFVEASEELRTARMVARGDALVQVEKRILGDRGVFQLKNFHRIDLHIYNEQVDINELAQWVHEHYQKRHQNKNG